MKLLFITALVMYPMFVHSQQFSVHLTFENPILVEPKDTLSYRIIIPLFRDTLEANKSIASKIDGAVIRTKKAIWVRNNKINKWIKLN